MESSIDEQVQTAADDSFRSDSVPSLPDEKGNLVINSEGFGGGREQSQQFLLLI